MQQKTQNAVVRPDADDILGQFLFSFGQGAGTMRVQRATIAAFRARYSASIGTAPGDWKDVCANVLGFVAQVGRLSALLATQAGRTAISPQDFATASRAIEQSVHGNAEAAFVLLAGPFCATPAQPVTERRQPEPVEPVLLATPGGHTPATIARTH